MIDTCKPKVIFRWTKKLDQKNANLKERKKKGCPFIHEVSLSVSGEKELYWLLPPGHGARGSTSTIVKTQGCIKKTITIVYDLKWYNIHLVKKPYRNCMRAYISGFQISRDFWFPILNFLKNFKKFAKAGPRPWPGT